MIMKQIKGMRRKFTYPAIPALLLALALAGCQREPVPAAGDVIRFSVSAVNIAPAPSKADPAIPASNTIERPGNPLAQPDCQLKVWASLNTGAGWKKVFNDPSIVLENESGNWTYNGDKYWNRDANYRFMALYPVDADVQSASSDVDQIKVNYTDNTQDLMVAATQLRGAGATTVDLAFLHTCSAVRVFFVDPDRGTQDVRYKITNLEIQGLYMAGTLTNNQLTFTWAPSGNRTSGYSWPETPGSSWNVPASYTAFTPWLFFIPQSLTDNSALSFTYEVNMGDGGTQLLPATLPINRYNNSDIVWESGKMYTYYIKIRPKAIEMTVEWTDWDTDGNDDTLTIE